MKDFRNFADEINATAVNYRMRDFQEIRKKLKGLTKVKTKKIFSDQTVHDDWASHSGGRTELQFNIGFHTHPLFRYGMAFSLQASQSLPNPLDLAPKIHRFNQYFQANRGELNDLIFYHYCRFNEPPVSLDMPLEAIPVELIQPEYFLFFGKTTPTNEVTSDEVLFLFDRLLPVYEFVEGNSKLAVHPANLKKGFKFKPGCNPKPFATMMQTSAEKREMSLRHNKLQEALHRVLVKQYGEDHVGTEQDSGRGSRVDLVVQDGKKYHYYEIKTNPNVRACIREGISQLLEYSYWPGGNEAESLIIVSENFLTKDAEVYIAAFRKRFNLPVYYQTINLDSQTLNPLQ